MKIIIFLILIILVSLSYEVCSKKAFESLLRSNKPEENTKPNHFTKIGKGSNKRKIKKLKN